MKIHVLSRLLLSSFFFTLLSGFAVSSSSEETAPQVVMPRPQVKIGGYHFEDSGDFIHSYGNLWGKFHFTPGKFVEATSIRNWISQEEDRVSGNGLQLLFGDSFGKRMEGRIGLGIDDYEGYDANLSYLISLAFPPVKKGYLTLKYEYGNVVNKVSRIDALKEDITSHEFSPTYYHWISKRWSYWGQLNLGLYSDENLRSTLNSSLTYMLKIDPSVSLTYALYYNAFRDKSELYWDPQGYLGHILLLRIKEDIGNLLTVNLGGSLGFSPTEKKRTNPGFSLRLSLPDSPRWGLDVTGDYKGGGRREDYYSYTTTSINLFYLP
jgi:hypothetical protein